MTSRDPTRQTYSTAILVVSISCLVGLTLWGQYGVSRLFALDVAVGVVSVALLPLLPHKPVAATLMLEVLTVISPAATPAATVGTLGVANRRSFTTAVAVGLAGIAAQATRGLLRPVPGLPYVWWLVLVVIAHIALVGWGALSQARRALIESLRERADHAEAEQGRRVAEARVLERARIAREMHDVLAHRLTLLATYAGALEYRPDAPPEQLSMAAGVIRSGAHQALSELRDVLSVLREVGSDDSIQKPQPVLADLPHLLKEVRDSGARVVLTDLTVASETLPATLSRTVYRVVQEGLTNARKHAPGHRVQITLAGAPGGQLTIELRNPLPGSPHTSLPGSGTGLIGLTERVRLVGGRIDHRAVREEFLLQAWLPFPECTP